jgi:hypothetical protein
MQTKNECKPMDLSDSAFIVCMSAIIGLTGFQQEGTAGKSGQKIDQAAENAGKNIETDE